MERAGSPAFTGEEDENAIKDGIKSDRVCTNY